MNKLYDQGKIKIRGFSIFLGNTRQQSKIWIGAYVVPKPDQSLLKWMSLTSNYHWQVAMPEASINGEKIALSVSKHAILDSGTSLTYVPTNEYQQVIGMLLKNRNCEMSQGFYWCRCSGVSDSSFPVFSMFFIGSNGNWVPHFMYPENYLG